MESIIHQSTGGQDNTLFKQHAFVCRNVWGKVGILFLAVLLFLGMTAAHLLWDMPQKKDTESTAHKAVFILHASGEKIEMGLRHKDSVQKAFIQNTATEVTAGIRNTASGKWIPGNQVETKLVSERLLNCRNLFYVSAQRIRHRKQKSLTAMLFSGDESEEACDSHSFVKIAGTSYV